MVEVLSSTSIDLEDRLRNIEVDAASSSINVPLQALHQGELRLDARYYNNTAVKARLLLEEGEFDKATLGFLVNSITYPTRFKRIYTRSKEYGVPFLQASMLLHFRPSSQAYLVKRQVELKECIVPEHWLLITRSGSVGRCVIVGKHLARFAITDDVIRVEPGDVPIGYLYAFLMSWSGQALLTKNQYGAVIKHLEPHQISGIPIPLLPDVEVNKISDGILTAYALREEANELLDDATNVFYKNLGIPVFDESLVEYLPPPESDNDPKSPAETLRAFKIQSAALNERFDASYHIPLAKSALHIMKSGVYPLVRLSDASENIILPGRFKRTYVDEKYGLPFLQGSHIPLIKPYDLKYIARKDTRNIDQCKIGNQWILVTRSGTIGKVGLVASASKGWTASEHLIRIIAKRPDYNPGYITLFLMTPYGQHQMRSKIYGAVVDELTTEDLGRVLIPDAPRDSQDAIGDKVIEAFEKKELANIIENETISRLEKKLEGSRGV